MTTPHPRLCCLDLDTFFVSVERLLDPALLGQPVIVGGRPGQRGVVTAASYEVRALGVRSGMSLTDAARLAPNAIYLPTRHGVYSDHSSRVRSLLERWCPVVRPASIDEFYLDFGGCEGLYRRIGDLSDDDTIERTVWEICRAIADEVGLPASAGIATSIAVSKIASGLAKPRGVLLVPAGEEAAFLGPLPVRRYPGVGPVAERRLELLGITTLDQLAHAPPALLRPIFGAWTGRIQHGAAGQGPHELTTERPAFHEHDPEGNLGSISNERTFHADVGDAMTVEAMLCALCERVCWRARRRGVRARTVTLKLRYSDFHTLSRSRTLETPTDSELELLPVVQELCARAWSRKARAIRLLGIALSGLAPYGGQLPLFRCHVTPLHHAMDALRERFGYDALRVATGRRHVRDHQPPATPTATPQTGQSK